MKTDLDSGLGLKRCFGATFSGKRVLVTGHTGFKGSWLCEWLLQLGADVTGLALPPPTTPALFDQLGLAKRMRHVVGDIRDLAAVQKVVADVCPDFVFHLAAQPLVRLSYEQPVETYATNVMGTAHVLEALRRLQNECKSPVADEGAQESKLQPELGTSTPPRGCVAVMVTTDKCYENREWVHSYREEDPMGGYDPYSSSKGAAELVIAAYRRSFFSSNAETLKSGVRVASARAGNVIGGGDWALDRIVPDCIRALQKRESIPVRNKVATRPWQHVLEPLSGYLWLAACLANPRLAPSSVGISDLQLSTFNLQLASAYNFGPALTSNRTVAQLVQEVLKHWPGKWEDKSDPHAVHEAKLLNLATDKAHHFLGWKPAWAFEDTIKETVEWYKAAAADPAGADALTRKQIGDYVTAAQRQGLKWASGEKQKAEN